MDEKRLSQNPPPPPYQELELPHQLHPNTPPQIQEDALHLPTQSWGGMPGLLPQGQEVVLHPPPQSPQSVSPQPLRPESPMTEARKQYQAEMYALCARGDHDGHRKFGACGIIAAIFLFPIGLIGLFADSEKRCGRCGATVG